MNYLPVGKYKKRNVLSTAFFKIFVSVGEMPLSSLKISIFTITYMILRTV